MLGQPDQNCLSPGIAKWIRNVWWYHRSALVAGVMRGGVQPGQRIRRLGGPVLLVMGFSCRDELSRDVRAAEGVVAVGAGVAGGPGVMHQGPGEAVQHPELVDRGPAPRA